MAERNFLKRLGRHKIIGIDTSPFICHLENDRVYSNLTVRLFEEVEKGSLKAVTSAITLMEVLVKPKEQGDRQAVEDYKFVLRTFPNLALRPIDETCAEKASDLRAEYGLRSPDALQAAVTIANHGTGLVTNDQRLKKIRELDVIVLDDFAKSRS